MSNLNKISGDLKEVKNLKRDLLFLRFSKKSQELKDTSLIKKCKKKIAVLLTEISLMKKD